MHKILVWATCFASVLASSDVLKRTNDNQACTKQGNTDNSTVTVHYVEVGKNGLTYTPDKVSAQPGDFVQFKFNKVNHTVTESSFDEPCKKLAGNLTKPDHPGVVTGFVPVSDADTTDKVFTIKVNDTKPIWLFCGQKMPKPHCQAGMVMVINEPADPAKSLQKYRENSAKVPVDGAPAGSSPAPSDPAAPPTAGPGAPAPSSSTDSSASSSAPATTDSAVSAGPALAADPTATSVATSPNAARPTRAPVHYAVGGMAVVGAMALL